MHIDTYTYNLLWNIPTNLQARYDLFCVKSAVKAQPTNLHAVSSSIAIRPNIAFNTTQYSTKIYNAHM